MERELQAASKCLADNLHATSMAVLQFSFLKQCFGRKKGGFIKLIGEKGMLIPAYAAACNISELENNSSVILQKMCLWQSGLNQSAARHCRC